MTVFPHVECPISPPGHSSRVFRMKYCFVDNTLMCVPMNPNNLSNLSGKYLADMKDHTSANFADAEDPKSLFMQSPVYMHIFNSFNNAFIRSLFFPDPATHPLSWGKFVSLVTKPCLSWLERQG